VLVRDLAHARVVVEAGVGAGTRHYELWGVQRSILLKAL
jgi:hypothetical protein